MSNVILTSESEFETAVHLSELSSIMTLISENKPYSSTGARKYPPNKFPLMWFIVFDNNQQGNVIAREMLETVEDLGAKIVRGDSYGGARSRCVQLYFKNTDAFDRFAENFIGEKPVTVKSYGEKPKSLGLNDFKALAAEVLKRITNNF